MILFSIISVSQTPQSHVLPSILAQASGKPVFHKLTLGSPGKRLACVVAQKVRAVTFMCCDGSNDDGRWILRIRAVKSGDEGSDVRAGLWRKVPEVMTSLFSSPLSSSTPPISSALRGGPLVSMKGWAGRFTTEWCLLLRSCLTRWRNTRSTSCWSRGHCCSTRTWSPFKRWRPRFYFTYREIF